MHNVIKLSILFVMFILLVGCASKTAVEAQNKGRIKVFDEEDIYILTALRLEEVRNYSAAAEMFKKTYDKSDKKEYLYRSLQNSLAAKKSEDVIKTIDDLAEDNIYDFELMRLKIIALVELNRLDEATTLSLSLVEKSNKVDDYLLVSDIYVKQKKYDTAVKYLESAYVKDYNEKLLDRIAIVLYVNLQRKKDAIAQLETHSRMHGCSRLICDRLIGFYSNDDNIDGLLATYLRIYKIDASKKVAKKIVQIYGYKKEYLKMIKFLEDSSSDDELLFQLYVQIKNYKKASLIAEKLYKSTGEPKYLGQSAIFQYESSKNKSDKEMHSSVIKKLKEVVEISKESVYINYLGYILIDHEIDVKLGIKYIKKALLIEPNSAYYLDSLAWGYYKLGECVKAKKVMDRVVSIQGSDNEEVKRHVNIINKCVKSKKGKNK